MNGEIASCSDRSAPMRPRTYPCVASENSVATLTKRIAYFPACSCRTREKPVLCSTWSGSDAPAMKPATQAKRVQREHERVAEEDAADVAEVGVGVQAGKQRRRGIRLDGRGDEPDDAEQRDRDRERAERPRDEDAARVRAPARERRAGVAEPLEQDETVGVHPSALRQAGPAA